VPTQGHSKLPGNDRQVRAQRAVPDDEAAEAGRGSAEERGAAGVDQRDTWVSRSESMEAITSDGERQ